MLMNQSTHLVAVYGSLKQGFYNHRLLNNAPLVAVGKVPGFAMYSMGLYPMAVRKKGSIQVEVYAVDSATFQQLDRLEGYPNFYDRNQVVVNQADTAKGPQLQLTAWLYFGEPQQVADLPRVRGGNWVEPVCAFR